MVTKENMLFRSIVMCASIATMSGCGVLHSDAREKQTTEVRENFTKIPLAQQIEVPRKNRKNLLEKEMATIDDLAKVRADSMVVAVVMAKQSSTVKEVLDMVAKDMDASSLTMAPEELDDIKNQQQAISVADDGLSRVSNEYSRIRIKPPECNDLATDKYKKLVKWAQDNPSAAGAAVVSSSDPNMLKYCEARRTAIEKIKNHPFVKLKEIREQINEEQAHLNDLKVESKRDSATFEELVKELSSGAKGKDPATLAADAKKLKAVSEALKNSKNAFTIQLVSKERLQSIDDFLSAVSKYKPGEAPPADAPKAALAVLFFNELFAEIGSIDGGNKDVSWSPLVMQKKIEKARLDAANREIDTLTKKISLSEDQYRLRFLQITKFSELATIRDSDLKRVHRLPMAYALGIEPIPNGSRFRKSDLPNTEEKINIHRAIAHYIDAGTRLDAEVKKIDLRKAALDSEIGLSYSESAINQWAALIDTNISSLETTYKLGITSKQINDVINSILLFWIGKGTNK